MEFLKTIFFWLIEKFKKFTFKDWIILIFGLLALGFCCSSVYYKSKANDKRFIYITDSLTVYKNKLKEEYAAKELYIMENKQLKEANADLYAEVKSLKDDPLVITKIKTVFVTDTVYANSDSIVETHVADSDLKNKSLYWSAKHDKGYYSIVGQTNVMSDFSSFSTSINSMKIPVTLTTDVIEKDKKLMIISKSDNPFVSITNMDGVMLDPKKSSVLKSQFKQKRWGVGPQIGIGIDRDLKFTPYVGIGLSYNIFVF